MKRPSLLSVILLAMALAVPALAAANSTGAQPVAIPEPSDYLLFAAGLIGLIVGRKAALSRRDRDEDEDA